MPFDWIDQGLAWWAALGGDWRFLVVLPFAVAALGLLRQWVWRPRNP